MVGARGLVPVCHGGALAQEQGPVVAEVVVIPGVLHRLDLQVLRGVPGNGPSVITIMTSNWSIVKYSLLIGEFTQYTHSQY